MPVSFNGLSRYIVDQGLANLRDAAEIGSVGPAAYIATGQPTGNLATGGQAVARAICRVYSSATGIVPEPFASKYEAACRPFLESINSGVAPAGDGFTGAQCAGQGYLFYPEERNTTTGVWTERAALVIYGPVTGRAITFDAGAFRTFWSVTGRSSGGSPLVSSTNNGIARANARWGRVTKLDGSPVVTECGSLPIVITQPQPGPTVGPRFVINASPTFNFDASINIQNSGNVRIQVGDTDITVDPFADPDGGGAGGSGGGGDRPPGDIGLPGDSALSGDGSATSGDAPAGSVLGALKLNFEVPPKGAKQYAPGIFRAACYVYMGTSAGLDLVPDGAMLRDGQLVLPDATNLTKWRVQANNGFNIRVTPYYVPVATP